MKKSLNQRYLSKIKDLKGRLEEAENLIAAIKAGEVDAFALYNSKESEIFTLQSSDYAYRVLIEEFSEGAVNITEDGLIVYTNNFFCDLLKLPYEKVIGSSFTDLVHPGSKKEFQKLFSEALKGKSKGEIILDDGLNIPVYVSLTSLRPQFSSVGIIITNLTEKINYENTLLEYQKVLEHRNKELVNTNAELYSFSHITSHDLQEPLRKIQTFASLIEENEIKNLSDNGKDYFNRLKLASQRMQTLIVDLLAYSRIKPEERVFENCDLKEIIEEVKMDLIEDIKNKNATIEVAELCRINIIPFQFRQLFQNLIANSLKFSKPKTAPHIKISGKTGNGNDFDFDQLSPDTKYCSIIVTDNGIGFETQYSDKIFEIFQRLHGKEKYGGTGIGLSIVKKIIDNHNGFITAKSQLNKGATFEIYIPVDD